jgi:hypothetical protein
MTRANPSGGTAQSCTTRFTVGEILSSIDAEDAEGVQIIADRVFARGSFWVVDD